MAVTHLSEKLDGYRVDRFNPNCELEPLEQEIAVVEDALKALQAAGVLPHTQYDHEKMLAHRRAVVDLFEIPWTSVSLRAQRLIYAINAIVQPQIMIAAGIFCGNTFISNAGAAAGPGACYTAQQLIGVEIKPEEAERAERNVRRIDPTGIAKIVCDDAVHFVGQFIEPIDLLYLDAVDMNDRRSKSLYLEILEAAYVRIPPGGVVVAHNSVDYAEELSDYLAFVRDSKNFRKSVNAILDTQGLEVSLK